MLNPYTKLYKTIKSNFLSGAYKQSLHRPFCDWLEKYYDIEVIDCDLIRIEHNGQLQLQIIVYDEESQYKLDISDFRGKKVRDVETLRTKYLEAVQASDELEKLMHDLNVSTKEIENLFVTVDPFINNLRWDINIHLDKVKERGFFDNYFEGKRYSILKEFAMILVLLHDKKYAERKRIQIKKELSLGYNQLLDEESPIKGIFSEFPVGVYVENADQFYKQYGNLRNFLN